MNIIKPSFEILHEKDPLKMIELAGRTCYKSEDKITDDSAERFVNMLIMRGHEAMLEHGYMIFRAKHNLLGRFMLNELESMHNDGNPVPHIIVTQRGGRCIISGNLRAWREFLLTGNYLGTYFFTHMPWVILTGTIWQSYAGVIDEWAVPITESELEGEEENRVHKRISVRFTVDRGISHEFVRHRVFSFAQESTRYCNYAADKFGGIAVIDPSWIPNKDVYQAWLNQCLCAEQAYLELIGNGVRPELARSVLPQSTKTELVMTGCLNDWIHFFKLRAVGEFGKPHPQAVEVAQPLMKEMMLRDPDAGIIRKALS